MSTLYRVQAILLLIGTLAAAGSVFAQSGGEKMRVRYTEASRLSPDAGDATIIADRTALSAAPAAAGDVQARVILGEEVNLTNFGEVVKITFRDSSGGHACTGVMLSPDAVLTAGHCGCGRDYEVSIQKTPVEAGLATAFIKFDVSSNPVLFPGYSCSDPVRTGIGRDLALLRVSSLTPTATPGTFEINGLVGHGLRFPVIRPGIQVLSDRKLKSLYILGFGRTETGRTARNLEGANVSLLSRHCTAGRIFLSTCAMFREFAMGRPGASGISADSCGGDSGGPAYRMDSDLVFDRDGQMESVSQRTLVGIVSRALAGVVHRYPGYCGGGGIYTTVGTKPVLEWLRAHNVAFAYDPSPTYQPEGD